MAGKKWARGAGRQYLRTDGGGGSGLLTDYARVYNSGAQTLTTAVEAALTFDSERWDTNNFHDTGSNTERLTIPTAGFYIFGAECRFVSNATGRRSLTVKLNAGATPLAQAIANALNGATHHLSVVGGYYFSAGDYIVPYVYQNSGGNLDTVVAGNASPEFWIVGPLG